MTLLTVTLLLLCVLETAGLGVSGYFLYRWSLAILRIEDAIPQALDVMDISYSNVADILEQPIYYNTPEVRQLLLEIERVQSSILYVANVLSLDDSEVKLGDFEQDDG